MATSIIIPGLTPDDKVPGAYQNIRYGAGRRGAAGTIYARLLASKLPDTPAANGSVEQSGSGPAVTVGGEAEVDTEYVLTITTAGSPGTAKFDLTANGDTVATGETVPTAPYEYAIPDTDLTITFANDSYVLSETYTWTSSAPVKNGTADYNVLYDVLDEAQGIALAGPGSEGDRMIAKALTVPGVSLQVMFIEPPAGAVAAHLDVRLGGSWSESGEFGVRLGGKLYRSTVLDGDSTEDAAQRLADRLNDDQRLFCSASVVDDSGTYLVRLTVKSLGVRGNFWSAFLDTRDAPPGFTATLDGGSALAGGGVQFTGGVGTDDVSDALEALLPEPAAMYNFYGCAPNDAVNAAAIRDQLIAKATPLVQQYEQACFGHNGSYASVITLAQTALNHPQCQVIFDEQGESHPSEIAALEAAIRSATEGSNPKPNYSQLSTRERRALAPRAAEARAIEPGHSKLKALLNSGVSPLRTVDGVKVMVRAITSKSLTNSAPDYSTLDVGQATVPMRMARIIAALWSNYAEENPDAGPDPDVEGGEAPAPEGVATPSGWLSQLLPALRDAESRRWIHKVNENPPSAEWDDESERIMSSVTVVVRPLNLQLGNEVRQQVA